MLDSAGWIKWVVSFWLSFECFGWCMSASLGNKFPRETCSNRECMSGTVSVGCWNTQRSSAPARNKKGTESGNNWQIWSMQNYWQSADAASCLIVGASLFDVSVGTFSQLHCRHSSICLCSWVVLYNCWHCWYRLMAVLCAGCR